MVNKTLFKFLAGGLALVALGLVALYAPGYWRDYQVNRAIFELERPYREDTYGGKTPEETFDMFLDALKKEDVELASKYFAVRKQDEYKEKFEKMQEAGILEKQIQEWERARQEWTKVVDDYNNWETHATTRYFVILEQPITKKLPDGAGGFIEHTFPAGSYGNDIIFDVNELTNVWKIILL